MERAPIIHLIDDDEGFRTAMARLLRLANYEVKSYASAGDFLLAPEEDGPGCILLDIQMPGPSGLDLQKALVLKPNGMPIIFLTGHGDIPSTVRAMKEGAVDFLTKPVMKESLLSAVERALSLDAERRARRGELRTWQNSFRALTPRERQVFEGVVAGKLNKQIAAELGTAERTVKAHRSHVMEKLKIGSVAELVRVAERLRLIPPK